MFYRVDSHGKQKQKRFENDSMLDSLKFLTHFNKGFFFYDEQHV